MKLFKATFWCIFFVLIATTVFGETSNTDLLQLFPERVGPFQRVGNPVLPVPDEPHDPAPVLTGIAEYSGKSEKFAVQIGRFHQDGEAYSAVTLAAAKARSQQPGVELSNMYGTAGFSDGNELVFFKGVTVVRIISRTKSSANLVELAQALSDVLDRGENEIAPLVKHLPGGDETQKRAVFLNRFSTLQSLVPNQTVLSVLDTGGDADAAFADTGSGKVLIVEYHTPQLAKDNDEKVVARIQGLWKLGEPAPIGYKRVGNYSVFVFDARDEATAKQLIDQVKYEQVVQWLGDNPNILKEAERRYVETTLGVFIAVLKASGFALVGCLGLGGLIGAFLFTRRRAQQSTQEAFSDAGGMLRLNIDELTPQRDPARLLGPGQ